MRAYLKNWLAHVLFNFIEKHVQTAITQRILLYNDILEREGTISRVSCKNSF